MKMIGAVLWLFVIVFASIVFRLMKGKPLFPRAPSTAEFAEAWCSGHSQRNLLTRIGGASRCLLVYVADGMLTIVPVFPFNLMFLPEIYRLEKTTPSASVTVNGLARSRLFGDSVVLTVSGSRPETFRLYLRNRQGFLNALTGVSGTIGFRAQGVDENRSPRSVRLIAFRLFAAVWGLGALFAGITGLAQDIHFRTHGAMASARTIGHTAQSGSKSDRAIVEYEVDGHKYTLTSLRGTGFFRLGDRETVLYLPAEPAEAREEGYLWFDQLWIVLGSIMLAAGILARRIGTAFNRAINI